MIEYSYESGHRLRTSSAISGASGGRLRVGEDGRAHDGAVGFDGDDSIA
jgi:hypothetical protein